MAREGLFKSMGTGYDDLQNQMYAQDQASVQKARFGSIPDYISRNVRQGELALQGGLENVAGMFGMETPRGKQLAKAAKIDNDKKIMMEKYKDASKDGKITEAEYDSLAADFASMGYGNAANTVMEMKRAEYGSKIKQEEVQALKEYKKELIKNEKAKTKAILEKETLKAQIGSIPKLKDAISLVKDLTDSNTSMWPGFDSKLGDALQKKYKDMGTIDASTSRVIAQDAINAMKRGVLEGKVLTLSEAVRSLVDKSSNSGGSSKLNTSPAAGYTGGR